MQLHCMANVSSNCVQQWDGSLAVDNLRKMHVVMSAFSWYLQVSGAWENRWHNSHSIWCICCMISAQNLDGISLHMLTLFCACRCRGPLGEGRMGTQAARLSICWRVCNIPWWVFQTGHDRGMHNKICVSGHFVARADILLCTCCLWYCVTEPKVSSKSCSCRCWPLSYGWSPWPHQSCHHEICQATCISAAAIVAHHMPPVSVICYRQHVKWASALGLLLYRTPACCMLWAKVVCFVCARSRDDCIALCAVVCTLYKLTQILYLFGRLFW